jgi:hypothetical protein
MLTSGATSSPGAVGLVLVRNRSALAKPHGPGGATSSPPTKHFYLSAIVAAVIGALIGGGCTLAAAAITARAAPDSAPIRLLIGPLPTTTATVTLTAPAPALTSDPASSPATATAASTYLSDIKTTDGNPRTGPVQVNGQTLSDSVYEGFGGCQVTETISYNLERSWSKFTATVGLEDASKDNSVVDFTVLLDDKQVYDSGNLALGASRPVNVDVTDGLRLKLKTVFVKGDMGACSHPGFAVWGNAALAN